MAMVIKDNDDMDNLRERKSALRAAALAIIGFVVVWWWAFITPPLV